MSKWTEEQKLDILKKIGVINGWGELNPTQFKRCPKRIVGSCNVYTEDPCEGCPLSSSALERKVKE